MNHKYSLDEIDCMREALNRRPGAPSVEVYPGQCGNRSTLSPRSESAWHQWKTETEDQLRTYMLGGVRPEELEAKYPPPEINATEEQLSWGSGDIGGETMIVSCPGGVGLFYDWGGKNFIPRTDPGDGPTTKL